MTRSTFLRGGGVVPLNTYYPPGNPLGLIFSERHDKIPLNTYYPPGNPLGLIFLVSLIALWGFCWCLDCTLGAMNSCGPTTWVEFKPENTSPDFPDLKKNP
jgi:hypothetical protein